MIDESTQCDDHAELALIGALAADPHAIAAVIDQLPGADFYHPNRGRVWDAARRLLADSGIISPGTLTRALSATGDLDPGTRTVLQHEMIRAFSGEHVQLAARYADVVADHARRRELAQAVKRAARIVVEHPGDPAAVAAAVSAEIEQATTVTEHRDGGTLTWPQLLDEFDAHQAPDVIRRGIETPWAELNEMLGDLRAGRMYVIGGQAGEGKSTVALNVAAHAAAGKESVLVFSKEMPTVDVTGRLIARAAEIDLRLINAQRLSDADRDRVARLRADTADYRLRVNADPVTMSAIKRISRRTHSRHGLDLLVVDYLQLMTGDQRARSREEEIARISSELKSLAMELSIAVVVPAQLNRAAATRPDQRPVKSDLRESGRIEQDADAVILLWRPPIQAEGDPMHGQPDPDHLVFIVDKNRHGPKGMVTLGWNGGYGVIS